MPCIQHGVYGVVLLESVSQYLKLSSALVKKLHSCGSGSIMIEVAVAVIVLYREIGIVGLAWVVGVTWVRATHELIQSRKTNPNRSRTR